MKVIATVPPQQLVPVGAYPGYPGHPGAPGTPHVPQPIDIVFKDITYAIEMPSEDQKFYHKVFCCGKPPPVIKQILKGVSGIIQHGKVTAIMGASGAGKTSLLNILSCRIDNGNNIKLGGGVFVNGAPYTFNNFGDFANYVMQNDILMQTLTVRETLEFAANLKLNRTKEEKDAHINKLVADLKLEKCIDVLIGGTDIKGISGGEKKRTSIAFELISDPQVLFLDEPTSGLDSLTAYVIVWYMKKLSRSGNKTIAMTIHQPSSEIFELFDNLFLLVAGRMIYQGPAKDSTAYFSQMGFNCPEFNNPPDYFMSIMHHQSKINVANYPLYFQSYDQTLLPHAQRAIETCVTGGYQARVIETTECNNLGVLIWRDLINIRRNPLILRARVLQTIILGLITGAIFYDLPKDYFLGSLSVGFNSRNGCLFFISTSSFMSSLSPIMLTFPQQRAVFLKEQSSKLYSVASYFLSRNVVELPYLIVIPLLFAVIAYWMIHLAPTAGQFFLFYFVTFLVSLAGNSFGLLVGSLFSDSKVASGLLPLIVLPLILFSGFYKNRGDLPAWIGWLEYLSPMKYSLISLVNNEYAYDPEAPVHLLEFNVSTWGSIGILIGLSMAVRFLSLVFLWLLKGKLQ